MGLRVRTRWGRLLTAMLVLAVASLTGAGASQGDSSEADGANEASVPPAVPRIDPAELGRWLDATIPRRLREADIAGATVAVVQGDRILAMRGYGHADVAAGRQASPDQTVLPVASVSKLITWTAVMQLVESGQIDLDADINDYLDFRIPDAFGRPVTMRHLMTHSAGFEDRWPRTPPVGTMPWTLAEYLHGISPPERLWPPGEVVAYSNYSVELAGYIIERQSGELFADYVRRHIFEPLGMSSSSFVSPPPQVLGPRLSRAYERASATEPMAPLRWDPPINPGGSLVTTASDMARFMSAYLQGGSPREARILQAESIRTMFQESDPLYRRTLGFWNLSRSGLRVLGQSGDDDIGFHAMVQLFPDQNVGLFVGFNSHGRSAKVLPEAMFVRESISDDFISRYLERARARQEPTTVTTRAEAEQVAGRYRWTRRSSGDFLEVRDMLFGLAIDLEIKANDDGTIVTPWIMTMEDAPRRWRRIDPVRWQAVDGTELLNVIMADGRVRYLWSNNAPYWYYEPAPSIRDARLNLGILGASCATLLFFTLAWPIGWTRRRLRRAAPARHLGRAELVVRWVTVLGLVYVIGWLAVFVLDIAAQRNAAVWIRPLQIGGVLIGVGTAFALAEAVNTWRQQSPWRRRIAAATIALALCGLIWFSIIFHLISWELIY